MNDKYIISCETTADMDKASFDRHDIEWVPFHFSLNGTMYNDDLGQTVSIDEFYRRLLSGEEGKSSQVSSGEYEAFFEKFLKQGKDVLHLCLSSGISGTYNSAMIAAKALEGKYPNNKLVVLDSLCASSGQGLYAVTCADLREEGKSFDEVVEWAKTHRLNDHHWFYSSDLTFFIKGGRVSKTAGFVGNMLHICPVLHVDREGKLAPVEKTMGERKATKRLIELFAQHAEGHGVDYNKRIFISHSQYQATAEDLRDQLIARFPNLAGKVEIFSIGTTIGCHTGKGTIAFFFFGDER